MGPLRVLLDLALDVALEGCALVRGRQIRGEPFAVGARSYTPISRAVALGTPRGGWGIRLLSPIGIEETRAGQEPRVVVIPRLRPRVAVVLVAIVGPVLGYVALSALFGKRRERRGGTQWTRIRHR
jgi:hypothetical protein